MGDGPLWDTMKLMANRRQIRYTDRWWICGHRMLTDEDCDALIQRSYARMMKINSPLAIRDVDTVDGLVFSDLTDEKMLSAVRSLNEERWNMEIDDASSYASRYSVGECINWHQDHLRCKLSATVQLSDPDAYEGGDLQLMVPGENDLLSKINMPRERGTMIVFPSWTLHRVTEVTEGERWSLVVMGKGPPVR